MVGILAVVAVIALLSFKHRGKVKLQGPGKLGLAVDGSNGEQGPAIQAEGIRSRGGGLTATDATGKGVTVKDVVVQKDISLSTQAQGPKA
jgi:hypothetical protein